MVRRIKDIVSVDLDEMLEESQRLGFGMIDRLIREWESGQNDFGKMNEALFAYESDGRLLGIGGVTRPKGAQGWRCMMPRGLPGRDRVAKA